MKTFAYLFNNYESPVVSISEACRRKRQLAGKWETWTYYDIIRLREMSCTCRAEAASSFTYKSQNKFKGHSMGSKGVTHELVQQYICNVGETWTFKLLGEAYEISIQNIDDEFKVYDRTSDRHFFIDCMIHLKPDCKFYDLFNGKIGIEVTDMCKTNNTKTKAFKDNQLTVLEVVTYKDWHLDNSKNYDARKIKSIRNRIIGFLKCTPSLNYLNLPNRVK